jgi:hypothetical protein
MKMEVKNGLIILVLYHIPDEPSQMYPEMRAFSIEFEQEDEYTW